MSIEDPRRDPVVIVSAVRTPMGGFQGDLATATAPELGATAIRAALERAGLAPDSIEEVIMGCVLPAGLGQALDQLSDALPFIQGRNEQAESGRCQHHPRREAEQDIEQILRGPRK